jgi:hypothetical protein
MRLSTSCLWAVTALVLTSCSRDSEVLDRLSRSYSSFLDTEENAEVASYIPLISSEENPNNQFWAHLNAALNTAASNAARVQSASACIAAYNGVVGSYVDHFSDEIQNLDRAVLDLIETANAVHNHEYRIHEYRNGALEVARAAREVQINFASMYELLVGRFGVQRSTMERLMGNGGDVVTLLSSRSGREAAQEVKRMSKEIDARRSSVAAAKQKCRDAFSALKGKAGLKAYPTRN